jgi:predicted amidophosphoribosyltransferase
MSAAAAKNPDIHIECPCCGARLVIDAKLGKVISHESPPRQSHAPDLDHAAALLREQHERREAMFRQSTEDEKTKSQLLERKFAEALKKSKDEPVTKPMRDFDLE